MNILKHMMAGQRETDDTATNYIGGTRERHADALRDALALLHQPRDFNVGDVIHPKSGLVSGMKTSRGDLEICIAFLETPIPGNQTDMGLSDTHYAHMYDMVFGHMSRDGAMILHIGDSRFYERAKDVAPTKA